MSLRPTNRPTCLVEVKIVEFVAKMQYFLYDDDISSLHSAVVLTIAHITVMFYVTKSRMC